MRKLVVFALLLATAPMASATNVMPEIKPEMRVVEAAAPSIRQEAVVQAAVAENRKATTRTVQRMNTTTIIIIVLAVIGAIVVLGAL
jgi:hypothetical protein